MAKWAQHPCTPCGLNGDLGDHVGDSMLVISGALTGVNLAGTAIASALVSAPTLCLLCLIAFLKLSSSSNICVVVPLQTRK